MLGHSCGRHRSQLQGINGGVRSLQNGKVPINCGELCFAQNNTGAIARKRAFICRAISVGRFTTSGIRSICLLSPKAVNQMIGQASS
jgi:hypothetical protein